MGNENHFLLIAWEYTKLSEIKEIFGVKKSEDMTVEFLAQGKYNINFLLRAPSLRSVLRLNTGSQMHLKNQIRYEYDTLKLLENSGVTPKPATEIFNECQQMAEVYLQSPLSEPDIKTAIEKAIQKVERLIHSFSEPIDVNKLVLNNTEVNSSNFLVDDASKRVIKAGRRLESAFFVN